ncbi:MAG: carboxylate-amine ligase [Pseudomonadota bacterium]
MERPNEPLTIGIEEEYLLIDPQTWSLATRPPGTFMSRCKEVIGPRVTHEFLQSQVEVGTAVCRTAADARAELMGLRKAVSDVAREHGLEIIAASSHPWAHWHEQEPVDLERYRIITAEHRSLIRRMSICGMHIHAGIEDKNTRVDLMGQMGYFMPHLLALSTSSPFWEGRDTGLKAFRPTILADLPRSGMPEVFDSWNDWTELLDDLAETGLVRDPSMIWWDIRPSGRHPTLELRICDVCSYIDDGISIAALYQSLLAYLMHLRTENLSWRRYRRTLLLENKFLAQRHGVDASLADYAHKTLVPFANLLDQLLDRLRPHAEPLGCLAEVERAREMATRGTSADHQLKIFNDLKADGGTDREAQEGVVKWLVAQTVSDTLLPPAVP